MNRSNTPPSPYAVQSFRLAGLAVLAVTLVFYLAVMAKYPFPSEWTAALGSMTGADPFRPLSRPLWQVFMTLLSWLFGASLPVAANAFSAVCGALTIWLVYEAGIRLRMRARVRRSAAPIPDPPFPRIVVGVTAAFFAAVSMPILYVSTRAHPLSLDMLLVMLALLLTLLYRDQQRIAHWYLFAAVYGLGLAEFATFTLLFPVFAVWWAVLFWKAEVFLWRQVVLGVGLMVAGVFLAVLFCALYYHSPVSEWREFNSAWMVFKYYLLGQVGELRGSVPKQGWLMVGLFMVAPAILVFLKGDETADDVFTKYSLLAFRLVLVGLGIVLLFNLPGSPWRITGSYVLLVTPYLLSALWLGQLLGFFYRAIGMAKRDRLGRPNLTPGLRLAQYLLLGAAGAALVAAGIVNARAAYPGRGRALHRLAGEIVENLDGRTWLVTDGVLDINLLWKSRGMNREIELLSLSAAQSPVYMRYLDGKFSDPAVRSMIEAGIFPLLNEWFATDPGVTSHVGVMSNPDAWSFRGFEPIPHAGYYTGRSLEDGSATQPAPHIAAAMALLQAYREVFFLDADAPLGLEPVYRGLAWYLSAFANNTGFVLQREGDDDRSEQAYRLALAYHPDNISAILNLGALFREQGRTNEFEALRAEWEGKIMKAGGGVPPPAQIAAIYGYLNDYRVFLEQGQMLASQGWGSAGQARFRQALLFAGEKPETAVTVAALLMDQGLYEQSARLLEAVLEANPEEVAALRLLARIRMMQQDVETGEALLDRLEAAGVTGDALLMERANLLVQQQQYDAAAELFRTLSKSVTTQGPAAMGMLQIAEATGQEALRTEAEAALASATGFLPGQLHLFDQAFNRRDLDAAAEILQQARRVQPGNPEVMIRSIMLSARRGERGEARHQLERLLTVDSSNPLGNYMLAETFLAERKYDLAEAALRRALEGGDFPDGLNALGWTLYLRGNYEEGLVYATRAVEAAPGNPFFLSTCGMLHLRNGQVDAAERMLRQAVEKGGESFPIFRIHLAEILATRGQVQEARELIDALPDRGEEWADLERDALDRVRGLLGDSAAAQ